MNATVTREIELTFNGTTYSVGGTALRPELVAALGLDEYTPNEDDIETGIVLWEAEFAVGYTFTAGYEGRTSGPYEDCYPGEPDTVEVTSVRVGGLTLTGADEELLLDIPSVETELLEDDGGYDD